MSSKRGSTVPAPSGGNLLSWIYGMGIYMYMSVSPPWKSARVYGGTSL